MKVFLSSLAVWRRPKSWGYPQTIQNCFIWYSEIPFDQLGGSIGVGILQELDCLWWRNPLKCFDMDDDWGSHLCKPIPCRNDGDWHIFGTIRGCLLLRGDYLSWAALGHGPSFFRWSRISCCGFRPFESAATANIITSTNSSFFLLGPPWFTASVVNGCLFGSEPLQLPLHFHQSTVTHGWLQRRYLKALPKHWARWGAMKVKSRRKSTTPKQRWPHGYPFCIFLYCYRPKSPRFPNNFPKMLGCWLWVQYIRAQGSNLCTVI